MDNERRKFKRFDAYMGVKCSNAGSEQKVFNVSLSRDVSRDGMCINTNENLENGSAINLEIDLPDDPRPVRTSGRVVWSKKSKEDEGIDYGIQFVTIDPVDKFRVLDYAYNHWLETKVNDYSDPEELSELN
jgi:c-di-GMP-binding flagellar brake protein YcgR